MSSNVGFCCSKTDFLKVDAFVAWLLQANRYTVALVLGVLGNLSMPPLYAIPLLFISFSTLYIILVDSTQKQSFFIGWWFGLGYFATGLYWFANALLLDIKAYGWLIPFAVLGISAYFALYFAISSLFFCFVKSRGLLGLITFSLSFTLAEWFLGNYSIFTAFPWNLFAYSWSFSPVMMQTASLFGTYGLVFITVFCTAALGVYYCDRSKTSLLLAVSVLLAMMLFGSLRLSNAENTVHPDVLLRLVQANTPAHIGSLSIEQSHEILNQYLELTAKPGLERITHVIWPESAIPFLMTGRDSGLLSALRPINNYFLLAGGARISQNEELYNSLFVLDKNAKITDCYDKHRLVPFGEFVPLFSFIKGITGDFTVGGEKNKGIKLNSTPVFAPLICYEIIFPGEVVDRSKNVDWMLNITNDVWFGVSSQPYQHFAISRMRSVEEGIPLIRVANSGISAVVDAYGRVLNKLPLNTQGIVDVNLPQKIQGSTIYAKYVSQYGWASWLVSALLIAYILFTKLRRRV